MRKRMTWIIISLLIMNLLAISVLFAGKKWISVINDYKISVEEFNEAFRAVILFGTLNSLVPVDEKQMNKIFNDKAKKTSYLRIFEDEYLIIKKAKERGSVDEKKIDYQVKILSKLIKRQIIIKKFIRKEIWPKVNRRIVKDKFLLPPYKKGKSKGVSKKYIRYQLKIRKTQIKFKEYIDKLRLSASNRGDKVPIDEFNESYRAVILFGALNSIVPVDDKQINKILNDKAKKTSYLRNFEDEYLIIKKAKEKGIIDEKKIDYQVKILSKLIKRQLIVKEFIKKEIWSKVKVKQKNIDSIYLKQKTMGKLKGLSEKKAKKYIKQQLKIHKTQMKFKDYIEKFRLSENNPGLIRNSR